jgi:ribonuclease R
MHDEATASLNGRRTRLSYRLAQEVEVRLAEASPVTGGLVFQIMQGVPAASGGGRAGPGGFRPGGRGQRR